MPTQQFSVDGLHCQGCVTTVSNILSALPGVESVTVDLDIKGISTVTVATATILSSTQIQSALDREGNFTVAS